MRNVLELVVINLVVSRVDYRGVVGVVHHAFVEVFVELILRSWLEQGRVGIEVLVPCKVTLA